MLDGFQAIKKQMHAGGGVEDAGNRPVHSFPGLPPPTKRCSALQLGNAFLAGLQGAYQPALALALFLPVAHTSCSRGSLSLHFPPLNPSGCVCLWSRVPLIYSRVTGVFFCLKCWARKTLACVGRLVTSACLSVS